MGDQGGLGHPTFDVLLAEVHACTCILAKLIHFLVTMVVPYEKLLAMHTILTPSAQNKIENAHP